MGKDKKDEKINKNETEKNDTCENKAKKDKVNEMKKSDDKDKILDEQIKENKSLTDELEKSKKIIEDLTNKKDEFLSDAQRIQAEFNNFRKRNAGISEDSFNNGMEKCALALLPVLDNLERAVDSAEKEKLTGNFIDGVKMVVKQFKDALNKLNISEIDALDKPFNPEFHNAVMQAECAEGQKKDIVVEELQKGYMMNGKVLRHSMVKVSK